MICSYNTFEPTRYCIPPIGLFAEPSLKSSAVDRASNLHASTAGTSVTPCPLVLQARQKSRNVGSSVRRLRLTVTVYTVYLHSQE